MPLQNSEKNNYLIHRDGSRTRRYGWKQLDSGNSKLLETLAGVTQFTQVDIGYWNNPGGNVSYPIVAVRITNFVYFFWDKGDKMDPFPITDRLDLREFRMDRDASVSVGEVSFTSGGTFLFITGEDLFPVYLNYEKQTIGGVYRDYIIPREIHVLERDVEGLEDNFGARTYPIIVDAAHTYNLLNQGWTNANITLYFVTYTQYPSNAEIMSYGYYVNPGTGQRTWAAAEIRKQDYGTTYAPRGSFIMNVNRQTWVTSQDTHYRIATAVYVPGVPDRVRITNIDARTYIPGNPVYIHNVHIAYKDASNRIHVQSINGWYNVSVAHGTSDFSIDFPILNYNSSQVLLASSNRSVEAALTLRPWVDGGYRDLDNVGFRAIEYHEGRVFLGGIEDTYRNIYNKRVYFSGITQTEQNFAQMHATNDPTSETLSDPLETDGGFITIPDIGTIVRIKSMGSSLVIFADNGIWCILPGADKGYFTAIDYSVVRLSDDVLLDKDSVVYVNGNVFYWSTSGISVISVDPASPVAKPQIQSISDRTIKKMMLTEVDQSAKISGTYDKDNNIIYWLYGDGSVEHDGWRLNRILVLDLISGSFYKLSANLIYESAGNASIPLALAISQSDLGLAASDAASDPARRLRMLRVDMDNSGTTQHIRWYEMTKGAAASGVQDFIDESPVARFNVETLPYLETSYEYGAGPTRKKWCTGVTCFFERTEDKAYIDGGGVTLYHKSGCLMRSSWEFTDSTIANKWGSQQQVYRLQRMRLPTTTYSGTPITEDWDNGYPVVKTRNKIRGQGSVLSLRFDCEPTKQCKLLGWHIDTVESRTTE
jgi:hypothetical protein